MTPVNSEELKVFDVTAFSKDLSKSWATGNKAARGVDGHSYRIKKEGDGFIYMRSTNATPEQIMNGATNWSYHRSAGEPWSQSEALAEAFFASL